MNYLCERARFFDKLLFLSFDARVIVILVDTFYLREFKYEDWEL